MEISLVRSTFAAFIVGALCLPQLAEAEETKLPEVVVAADEEKSVAHEKIDYGVLGEREIIDTPVSVTTFDSELIENQQSHTISELLANDPSVRAIGQSDGNYDNLMIRGFNVTSSAWSLNGLYGVLPWNTMSTEAVERVEVIKGPATALTGLSPFGAVGGAVNIVPKRAADTPMHNVTLLTEGGGDTGAHLDLGRRFGEDKEFGARFNLAYRQGTTEYDVQSEEVSLAVGALDYRSDRARVSLDFGYQEFETDGATFSIFMSPGVKVPEPLDSGDNPFPGWSESYNKDTYAVLNAEYDITTDWTAYFAAGTRDHESIILNPFTQIDDADGNVTVFPYHEPYFSDTKLSTNGGIRGRFETGPLAHSPVFSASYIRYDTGWFDTFFDEYQSNLYNPADVPEPDLTGTPDEAEKRLENSYGGFSVADTLSVDDERYQLTLGLRQQYIEVERIDDDPENSYDDDDLAPVFAFLVKVLPELSAYASYTEALSEGPIAPANANNAGEVFAPIETEQYEAGLKLETGRLLSTLAVFDIKRPSGLTDANNDFGITGEQRNQGVELVFSGAATEAVRLLGGASYIDAELTETEGGLLDGNSAVGVPKVNVNLGAEWDLPILEGLTVSARVIHTGKQFVDAEGTQSIPDWTRIDAGARYRFDTAVPVTLRMNVLNVADADYWASSTGGGLTLGTPLTLLMSATAEF